MIYNVLYNIVISLLYHIIKFIELQGALCALLGHDRSKVARPIFCSSLSRKSTGAATSNQVPSTIYCLVKHGGTNLWPEVIQLNKHCYLCGSEFCTHHSFKEISMEVS